MVEKRQDENIYKEMLERKRTTRLCCDLCGRSYLFENMNMCMRCASVVCYRCVWNPETKNTFRACQCGGSFE